MLYISNIKDLGLVVSDKKIDKNNIFETYLYDAMTYLGNKLVPFKTRVTKLLFRLSLLQLDQAVF